MGYYFVAFHNYCETPREVILQNTFGWLFFYGENTSFGFGHLFIFDEKKFCLNVSLMNASSEILTVPKTK